jgi:hypothetical protein
MLLRPKPGSIRRTAREIAIGRQQRLLTAENSVNVSVFGVSQG